MVGFVKHGITITNDKGERVRFIVTTDKDKWVKRILDAKRKERAL